MRPNLRRRRLGITIVEMSVGLAITVLVAAAVAAAMTGTSAAWSASGGIADDSRDDYRAVLRLQAIIARSRLIGAVTSGSLTPASGGGAAIMLWMSDDNADGQIQLLELGLLEHDPAADVVRLQRVQYPASWSAEITAANNPTYTYAQISSSTAVEEFRATSYLSATTVVRDVTGLRLVARAPAGGIQQPSVEYAMVLVRDGNERQSYGTATLRCVDSRPAR